MSGEAQVKPECQRPDSLLRGGARGWTSGGTLLALTGLLFFFVLAAPGAAQTFTFFTLAGSVTNYGSADGTNTNAQFYFPSGIAVDQKGNLFVADTSNNTIRKVTPMGNDWVVSTIAGTAGLGSDGGTNDGVNADARFWRPNGIAVSETGDLFVVDHYNHTIRKITPVGTNWVVTTIAGAPQQHGWADGTNSDARFYSPTGIAIDHTGNLFVADTFTFTIRKLTPVGTNWVVTTIAGFPYIYGFLDGTNGDAQFNGPYGICVDASNVLYVADNNNHAIRKVAPVGNDWVVSTVAGTNVMGSLNGTNGDALFNYPADVAVDRQGTLYVTDQSNNTIRKITPVGTNWLVSTIGGLPLKRGSVDGPGAEARFNWPWGITLDAKGNLYLVDWRNSTIRLGVPAYAPPRLDIALLGDETVVSWPLWAVGFVLEFTPALPPSGGWTVFTDEVSIVGNSFALTNTVRNGSGFYRLISVGP